MGLDLTWHTAHAIMSPIRALNPHRYNAKASL
ncbi:uncharacterized protein G2W53_028919 [Senna tora]|uniref:Uncharacterized protein n=1 Tax=Senna tora TaxID=362788 RepID=A0A834T4W7_9FABA|nr:uncharacterized protein G2W53_028919 [Senna tora]